jgi:hypothetical protein
MGFAKMDYEALFLFVFFVWSIVVTLLFRKDEKLYQQICQDYSTPFFRNFIYLVRIIVRAIRAFGQLLSRVGVRALIALYRYSGLAAVVGLYRRIVPTWIREALALLSPFAILGRLSALQQEGLCLLIHNTLTLGVALQIDELWRAVATGKWSAWLAPYAAFVHWVLVQLDGLGLVNYSLSGIPVAKEQILLAVAPVLLALACLVGIYHSIIDLFFGAHHNPRVMVAPVKRILGRPASTLPSVLVEGNFCIRVLSTTVEDARTGIARFGTVERAWDEFCRHVILKRKMRDQESVAYAFVKFLAVHTPRKDSWVSVLGSVFRPRQTPLAHSLFLALVGSEVPRLITGVIWVITGQLGGVGKIFEALFAMSKKIIGLLGCWKPLFQEWYQDHVLARVDWHVKFDFDPEAVPMIQRDWWKSVDYYYQVMATMGLFVIFPAYCYEAYETLSDGQLDVKTALTCGTLPFLFMGYRALLRLRNEVPPVELASGKQALYPATAWVPIDILKKLLSPALSLPTFDSQVERLRLLLANDDAEVRIAVQRLGLSRFAGVRPDSLLDVAIETDLLEQLDLDNPTERAIHSALWEQVRFIRAQRDKTVDPNTTASRAVQSVGRIRKAMERLSPKLGYDIGQAGELEIIIAEVIKS